MLRPLRSRSSIPITHQLLAATLGTIVLIVTLAVSALGQPPPTIDVIVARWKSREDRIVSAEVELTRERTDVIGAYIPTLLEKGVENHFEDGIELILKESITLGSNNRWRYERKGDCLDFTNYTVVKEDSLFVLDGNQSKSLIKYGDETTGFLLNSNSTMPDNLGGISQWPLVWFLRPLHPDVAQSVWSFDGYQEFEVIESNSGASLFRCQSPESKSVSFVVDAQREYRITELSAGTTQIVVNYREHPVLEYAPDTWTTTIFDGQAKVRRKVKYKATKIDINTAIPDGRFDFEFPVATRVIDARNGNAEALP